MKQSLFIFLIMCFSLNVTAQKDYRNETLQLKKRIYKTSIITFGSNKN